MNLVLEKKKCATKNKGTVKVMKVTKEKNNLLTQNSPKILDKKKTQLETIVSRRGIKIGDMTK